MVTTVLRFSDRQRAVAALALWDLERGAIARKSCNAVLEGVAKAIVNKDQITGERADKYAAMMLLYQADPVRARFLGGTYRATLAEDKTEQLAAIDRELRAQIVAICQMVFEQAVEGVATKAARKAKATSLQPVQRWSLDNESAETFLKTVTPEVRNAMFAALTTGEEEETRRLLANAAELIEELLEQASPIVAASLTETESDVEASHDRDRPRAIDLFLTAMTARVLGRLGRFSDGETAAVENVNFWDTASDVLAAAGGAATNGEGGLVTNEDSLVLAESGEPLQGTGFAQGHTSSVVLEEEGLIPVVYFRHSGGTDGNPIHVAADGLKLDDTQARAGTTAGCNCWHETVYEEAE